jgi:hypothetical protein
LTIHDAGSFFGLWLSAVASEFILAQRASE